MAFALPTEPVEPPTVHPALRRRRAVAWFLGLLGAALSVAGWRIPPVDADSDDRLDSMQSLVDQPHAVSDTFVARIEPALQQALDGGTVDGPLMTYVLNAFLETQAEMMQLSNAWCRTTYRHDFGQAASPLLDVIFEWDDLMMAALSADGTEVVDFAALQNAQGAGFEERIRAAEDAVHDDLLDAITRLRWWRGLQMASEVFVPVGIFLVLVAGLLPLAQSARQALDANALPASGAAEGDVADHEADAG